MTLVKKLLLPAAMLLICSCDEGVDSSAHAGTRNQQEDSLSSRQCAACHAKEYEEWAGSDHAWAYRNTRQELDSEPFHGQQLNAHGSVLTFTTSREGNLLLSDSQSGRTFTVHSVLGRRPLVQYLVQGDDGSLHTPSAAWDTEKREWFDMFEADTRLSSEGAATRSPGDWGHWLGRGMNWNSQCAWCHTTHFRKNYDATANHYASTWREPGVSCLQCHKAAETPSADGCLVAPAHRKLSAQQVHDNCATCHARREEFDDRFVVGDRFDDHFRLELPTIKGIFWPNGMQRDESYCETGIRLSRMGAAGVTCLDCHNPHTATLKLPQEDNSLCMRCHASGTVVGSTPSPVINPATHTPCPQNSKGARCVECHMPESPYMARDLRRDHSFNSPDPTLSAEIGTPNACIMCHTDKDNAWAAEVIQRAYPEQRNARYRNRTRAIHHALEGNGDTEALLAALKEESVPGWKATILELLAWQEPSEAILQAARDAAKDENAMVRAAAARVLGEEAESMIHDSVLLVRRAAAWPIIEKLIQNPEAADIVREQESIVAHQSDQPTGAMQQARLAEARQQHEEAERQYQRALQLDPASAVVYMDYAVFLARRGRNMDALQQMINCTKVAPDNPEVFYRLGLIFAELERFDYALSAFNRTLELDAAFHRARYNKAILLQHLGRHDEASREIQLMRALQSPPTPSAP